LEKITQLPKRQLGQLTERFDDPWLWYPYFTESVINAWAVAKAALSLRPLFVFGQEVTSYGLATALCKDIPKILLPWGHDIFLYAETSPFLFALTKFSLNAADLVVPASVTAVPYICGRFGVTPHKVHGISWGVNKRLFKKANEEERRTICSKWRIDPESTIILNARRFRPAWGCFTALEVFTQIARENSSTHFIMLGGKETGEYVRRARATLAARGLSSRFTLFDGDIPLTTCAELMSITDVFLSLLRSGDMRSSSVLQAAAAGGVPIISDVPEYREIEKLGFTGVFVKPDSIGEVLNALRFCIEHPGKRKAIVRQNDNYISTYEDDTTQMAKLLDLIRGVVALTLPSSKLKIGRV
jgi:glycosyltransferase involved in cell wall biosynthesis